MASGKPKKKNPRLASGRKRARQTVKLNAANTSLRSKYRTAVKNVEKAVLTGDKAKATDGYDGHQRHHDLCAQSEWKEADAKIQNGDRQDHGLNQIPKLKETHDAPRVRKVCRNVVDLIIHPNPPPRLLIADLDIAAAFPSARQGIAHGS